MSLKVAVKLNTLKLVLFFLLEKIKEVSELLCVYLSSSVQVVKNILLLFFMNYVQLMYMHSEFIY